VGSNVNDSNVARPPAALPALQPLSNIVNGCVGAQALDGRLHANGCHSFAVAADGVEVKATGQIGK
jgi:hypothetical protein